MTTREKFAESLKRSRKAYIKAAISIVIAIIILVPVSAILQSGHSEENTEKILSFIVLPFQIYFLYQIYRFISIIFREIKCPDCGKSMKHLALDPSYSKKFLFFGPPINIPEDVTECPYCKASFDK